MHALYNLACQSQVRWIVALAELIVLQQMIIWLVGGSTKQNQTRSETSLFYEDYSMRGGFAHWFVEAK